MSKLTFQDQTVNPSPPNTNELTLFAKGLSLFSVDGTGTVIDYTAISTLVTSDDVTYPDALHAGAPTGSTTTGILRRIQSAGLTDGGLITQGVGESIDVSSGAGGLRGVDDDTTDLFIVAWPAVSTLPVPTDTDVFVGVRFNSGTPEVFTKVSNVWNYNDEFPLGAVVNNNSTLFIINDPHDMHNLPGLVLQRFYETQPLAPDVRTGGFRLGDSADNNQNIIMSSGALWDRLNRLLVDSIDTGSGDTFSRFFSDGTATGFTEELNQTQWSNTFFDDGSGTLAALGTDQYTNQWIWVNIINNELILMYGTDQYATLAEAESEAVPSPRPELIDGVGTLLGRIISQQGVSLAIVVQNVSDFTPELGDVSNHSLLSNLDADDHLQYAILTGIRDFTATVGGLDPVASTDFATKNYVDTQTISGTIANNQVVIGSGVNTVDGSANFTWDDTTLDLTGAMSISSNLDVATAGLFGAAGTPGAGMILEVRSTIGALMLPRMTTGQRNAFTGVNGMLIYNTSDGKIQGFAAGSWVDMT